MKMIFTALFILIIIFSTNDLLFGQVNSVGLNGSFTFNSIATAYATIGTVTFPQVIELRPTYNGSNETAPVSLRIKTGVSSINTITIRPQLGANGLTLSKSSASNYIIRFDSCKFVILDGRPGGITTSPSSYLNITNTATGTSAGAIGFFGAENCKLQYINATGVSASTGCRTINIAGGILVSSKNNIVQNNVVKGGLRGIQDQGTSITVANLNDSIRNNDISQYFNIGIFSSNNTGLVIKANRIHFTSSITTTAIFLIGIQIQSTLSVVDQNEIDHLTSTNCTSYLHMADFGINSIFTNNNLHDPNITVSTATLIVGMQFSGTGTSIFSGNQIHDFNFPTSTAGSGIIALNCVNNGVGPDVLEISKNNIYNLNSLAVASNIRGISVIPFSGSTININNNIVSITQANLSAAAIFGILIGNSSSSYTANVYFNSIRIGGSKVGGTTGQINSYGILRNDANTGSTYRQKNNISINNRVTGDANTQNQLACSIENTNGTLDIDYNTYKSTDTAGGYVVQWIDSLYRNGELSNYKNYANPYEAQTNFTNVTFLSNSDLHLSGSSIGDISLAGIPVAGITTDIDSEIRNAVNPYKGADESTVFVFPANTCDSSLVENGNFQSAPWATGYGSPVWIPSLGCEDLGYMILSGNRKTGSAIVKTLNSQILAGHVYELSLCAKLDPVSATNYAKIRAVAFNGMLPGGGSHPAPASNIAFMDVSGKINCGEWSTYTFQRWRANKNFTSIALNCENNFGSSWIPLGTQTSTVDIDDICLREVSDSMPCYIADFDSLGNVVPPPGDLDPLCPAMEDTIDMYLGNISDLYPNCGTENDSWYHNCPDSCSSIGGDLPDSLSNFMMGDSITNIVNQFGFDSVNALYDNILKVEDSLNSYASNMNMLDSLFNLGALPDPCDTIVSKGPPPDPSGASPFGGRDIIYVHGFRTTPIINKINGGDPDYDTKWPADRPEFYDMNGYWKIGANEYWRDQIVRELHTNPEGGHIAGTTIVQNRFLVVSHSSTQLGIVGVHAILEQIIKTMNGTNDAGIINCGALRPGEKFGQNGFVIISHSAGSLLSNVALSLAGYVNKIPGLKGKLGNIANVADKCDIHIAIQGAFKGSADPVIALALAAGFTNLVSFTSALLDIFGINFAQGGINWLWHTQLLDLAIPNFIYNGELFAKLCPTPHSSFNPFCLLANAHLIEDVPMEVVTVAGGNSSDYGASGSSWPVQIIVKQLLQRGFDDGVLSMDCQCGNKITRPYYPNRYLPVPGILTLGLLFNTVPKEVAGLINERLYDLGINLRDNKPDRAFGYYLDQKVDVQVSIYLRRLLFSLGVMQTNDPRLNYISILSSYMHASSSCIPSLSPTGMVQPELEPFIPPLLPEDISYNPLNRMDHHHSFIQSTSEHYSGVTNEYESWPNYKPSHGITNSEEVRAMESNYLYDNNLVSQTMKTLPVRYIKGRKIGPWRIPFTKKYIGPFYIWKRFYDQLPGIVDPDLGGCGSETYSAECEKTHQLDYVYRYVLAP